MFRVLMATGLLLAGLSTGARETQLADYRDHRTNSALVWSGEGMSKALPSLVQISQLTNFFLSLQDDFELRERQREVLLKIAFEHESVLTRKSSEYQLATAKMNTLLAEVQTDLRAVESLIQRRGRIRTEIDLLRFESALTAVRVLSHEQHMEILRIVREIAQGRGQAISGSGESP